MALELAVSSPRSKMKLRRVIVYGIHTFTKGERNYSVTSREMLALIYFLETFSLLFAWKAICGQNRSFSLDLVATGSKARGTSG